jgi:hypothetical protein
MVERIQLSRRKGWRMPDNTVKVDRTTRWGNLFIVGKDGTREECVELYRRLLGGYLAIGQTPSIDEQHKYRAFVKCNLWRLRGKNLACWCPPDAPCHADALLLLTQGLFCEEVKSRD